MSITYINRQGLIHRSDAVIHNGVAYLAGVIASDTSQDIIGQTKQVLEQLDERLIEVGSSRDRILSATIWLVDVNRDIHAFNSVWNPWCVQGRLPVRSCIQSTPLRGSLLEVAVVAAV